MEKTMENHLVDPTENSENAESSENVTNKRNQKYITPNNRLTIFQNFSKNLHQILVNEIMKFRSPNEKYSFFCSILMKI